MPSTIRIGNVAVHDYAGVATSALDLHATRIGCTVANYQMRLPGYFPERPINAYIVPDNIYKEWFTPEGDHFKPPECRPVRVIPPACYGIVDDRMKFPASLLMRLTIEPWEVESISHEVLHAGSRQISREDIRCGIAFCDIFGKTDSSDRSLNEGLTEHLRMSLGGAVVENRYYPVAMAIGEIAKRVGEDTVLSAYFHGEIDPFIAAVERAFGPGSYTTINGLSHSVMEGKVDAAKLWEVLRR